MLVLSRKSGEKIRIGDEITIEVRRVAGNRVALAFDAPNDVRILRGELRLFDEDAPEDEKRLSDSAPMPLCLHAEDRHATT